MGCVSAPPLPPCAGPDYPAAGLEAGRIDVRTLKNACQWLSSGSIAVVVSILVWIGVWIAYKALHLEQRLGVDEGICALGLLVGPMLIRAIHRGTASSWKIPTAFLALGLTLGGVGLWQILRAREAGARHVPSGPFSGIEHVFDMALGLGMALVGVLAVLGGALALVGRRMGSEAEPKGAANGSQPRHVKGRRPGRR
jgi:hypothetical protein